MKIDASAFELAQRIRQSRALNSPDLTLDFVMSVFEEQGLRLSPCQALSITYLAWHESALISGVTWRDHTRKLAPSDDCALDEDIRDAYLAFRERQREVELAAAETRERADRMLWGGLAAGVTLASLLGGFIIHRRLKLTEQAELQAERRRQRRRAARRVSEPSAADQPLRESGPDASA